MPTLTRRKLLQIAAAQSLSGVALVSTSACKMKRASGDQPNATHKQTAKYDKESIWQKANIIAESIRAPQFPDSVFKASHHNLQASDARPAIMAAIEACHMAGGGRVEVPDGEWLVDGPIHFKSNVELHLAENCHLRFSPNRQSYLPAVFTRWEGTEAYNYSPFIYGIGLENIALTGRGTIDGQGEANWLPMRKKQKPDQTRLRNMGRDGAPLNNRIFGDGHSLRPHFVQFVDCQRVLVDGPTLKDSPFWCLHPVYCNDVIVRNITIDSMHLNSDGVDPDSCTNVLIENCEFTVGDDGVALKAGRDQDGWRVGKPCRRIVIRNNRYSGNAGGGMAIGSEMSGGVSEVYVDGYDIPSAHHGLYFKANLDRGGLIEDIHIRNIVGGDISSFIIFTNDYHSYRGGDYPPRFENISISNARCKNAEIGLHITGDPRAPVRNIMLDNIAIDEAKRPMQLADVENIQLSDVNINGLDIKTVTTLPRDQFLSFKR